MSIEDAPGFEPFDILYQDDDLLVANKPSTLRVHLRRDSSYWDSLLHLSCY